MNELLAISFGDLLARLRSVGGKLQTSPRDTSPLRQLQHFVYSIQYSGDTEDCRYVAFTLWTFIDDFFFNLAGEVPYSEEVQHALVADIGRYIVEIAEAGSRGSSESLYVAQRSLALRYLDSVKQIQESTSEH